MSVREGEKPRLFPALVCLLSSHSHSHSHYFAGTSISTQTFEVSGGIFSVFAS